MMKLRNTRVFGAALVLSKHAVQAEEESQDVIDETYGETCHEWDGETCPDTTDTSWIDYGDYGYTMDYIKKVRNKCCVLDEEHKETCDAFAKRHKETCPDKTDQGWIAYGYTMDYITKVHHSCCTINEFFHEWYNETCEDFANRNDGDHCPNLANEATDAWSGYAAANGNKYTADYIVEVNLKCCDVSKKRILSARFGETCADWEGEDCSDPTWWSDGTWSTPMTRERTARPYTEKYMQLVQEKCSEECGPDEASAAANQTAEGDLLLEN